MLAYSANTQGMKNLARLHFAGWRILLQPGRQHSEPPRSFAFRFAIDNGAWRCFTQKLPFNSEGFTELVEKYGAAADWVVIPDKVAAGQESLDFSKSWIDRLKHLRLILLAVQDGMSVDDVGALLERHPNMGIFVGGSTEWKERTLYGWGMVAHAMRRYLHVGRVNTCRRIALCAEAGASSFDGTSATMFSKNIPMLDAARAKRSLLTPENLSGAEALENLSGK